MSTVYAPQQPARLDPTTKIWIPSVNLKPAEKWGDLKIMFEQHVSRAQTAPIAHAMKEIMANYSKDDCIVAVGDPSLIAVAACLASRKCGGLLRLLKWDKMARDYILVEVNL